MRRLPLVLLIAVAGCSGTPGEAAGSRPNVLVLMLDDHSADVFGAYGSRTAKTPHLDKLAASGVRFDRAYANQPVCTPSRQSILTGLYPHAAGVTLLGTPLKEETLTLADHLGAHGYRTASIGKMHFNSRLKHGFETRVDAPEYQEWLKASKPAAPGARVRARWQPFKTPAREWLNAEGLPEGRRLEDTQSAFFVRAAIDFMKASDARPFLLWLSLYEPHSPFNFPVEYAGRFNPKDFPVPAVGPEDPPQIPVCFRDLTDDDKRGIAAAYHASLAFADEMLGRVLTWLRVSGLVEKTLVVYLSDHGYHLGHHGRFEKHSFYERAVRAPLVFSWPGGLPGRSDELAELVDVFPTICHLAGVPPPANAQGRVVLSRTAGDRGPRRAWVMSTYTQNEEAMIRTEEWKLIYCTGKLKRDDGYVADNPTPGRYRRLYHMVADPEEMKDVARDHPEIVRRLQRHLLDRLNETWPPSILLPAGLAEEEAIDFMLQAPEKVRR